MLPFVVNVELDGFLFSHRLFKESALHVKMYLCFHCSLTSCWSLNWGDLSPCCRFRSHFKVQIVTFAPRSIRLGSWSSRALTSLFCCLCCRVHCLTDNFSNGEEDDGYLLGVSHIHQNCLWPNSRWGLEGMFVWGIYYLPEGAYYGKKSINLKSSKRGFLN